MSLLQIRQVLEMQLATVLPALDTANENFRFQPSANVPYQRLDLLPAETSNPSFGDNFRRESGIFQVMLCYPIFFGSANALTQAELICLAFRRGSSFTAGGITVQIDRTPTVASAIIDADRYCVPVRVRYFANVTD